ncbi:MAG: hypothetical protein KatS3mg013_1194 [Actinomycetota bacterium]|nr:MAG: hypothetical protein KatS3mg013_1194 [Actinomycetota bacterium]
MPRYVGRTAEGIKVRDDAGAPRAWGSQVEALVRETLGAPEAEVELDPASEGDWDLVVVRGGRQWYGTLKRAGWSFDREQAEIARSRRQRRARERHDFEPARWTTRDGRLRCRVCGEPAPAGGRCPGLDARGARSGPMWQWLRSVSARRKRTGVRPPG